MGRRRDHKSVRHPTPVSGSGARVEAADAEANTEALEMIMADEQVLAQVKQ